MKRWQLVNLVAFIVLVFATVSLVYVLGTMNYTTPLAKPWHLLPSIHEDSLSTIYKKEYQILGKTPLRVDLFDSSQANVFILIDAWGVPLQEHLLKDDLIVLDSLPHQFALHRRLANYTRHAEHAEFRNDYANSIFLFGGDSLQFHRQDYIPTLGFQNMLFCAKCSNETMLKKIDSLLNRALSKDSATNSIEQKDYQFIAWTATVSPNGDHNKIQHALQLIADFARRHPKTRIVIQGTHRPVLCGPNTRNNYLSHWVPVVVLNP